MENRGWQPVSGVNWDKADSPLSGLLQNLNAEAAHPQQRKLTEKTK
jgi:hypothetical protein